MKSNGRKKSGKRGRSAPKSGWELFPHGADIGVRGFGPTREAAFEQVAVALMAVITEPGDVLPVEEVTISCTAKDSEFLMVEWLNELVYAMATKHMLFSRFEVELEDNSLKARAWGEKVDVTRHAPATEVKGATFTALEVRRRRGGGWIGQCVVDV
jgi:tRNA nucleotidyltransferase (CCA-adding enzyme)